MRVTSGCSATMSRYSSKRAFPVLLAVVAEVLLLAKAGDQGLPCRYHRLIPPRNGASERRAVDKAEGGIPGRPARPRGDHCGQAKRLPPPPLPCQGSTQGSQHVRERRRPVPAWRYESQRKAERPLLVHRWHRVGLTVPGRVRSFLLICYFIPALSMASNLAHGEDARIDLVLSSCSCSQVERVDP